MTPLERAGKAALSAVCSVLSDDVDLGLKEQAVIARAVLQAIREPSEIMAFHGRQTIARGNRLRIRSEKATDVWQAMIDAALAEPPAEE